MERRGFIKKILWVSIFAIAMALVESAVVVYLRELHYPEGFRFPLKLFVDKTVIVEIYREIATVVMLLSIGTLIGRVFWERFAYFLIAFGVWDIFYYAWLKVFIDWPASIFEWDILFLIPVPWIGPVIAPLSIAILMTFSGALIAWLFQNGNNFRPLTMSYIIAAAGVISILYSFMWDTGATLNGQPPRPYYYELLIIGDVLFIAAFSISYQKRKKQLKCI